VGSRKDDLLISVRIILIDFSFRFDEYDWLLARYELEEWKISMNECNGLNLNKENIVPNFFLNTRQA
jgi:hypothetical protein